MSGDKFSRRVIARRTKIDWLELHRDIETRRARSARRAAFLSQRKGGKRAMLGLLQFRHARRRIRETGHGPCRVDDDCFPGSSAIMTLPSLVTISNVPCAKSLYVMRRHPGTRRDGSRPGFPYGDESQCGERQDADPRSRAVPRMLAKGVSMLRPPALAILPATKAKAPWTRLNRAEFGAPARRNKFVQHQARGGGKIEHSAVDESNADGAIRAGLDRIAPINQSADAGPEQSRRRRE